MWKTNQQEGRLMAMVDIDFLKYKIKQCGYPTLEKFADALGLTLQGLLYKLNGARDFKLSEILQISQMLELNQDERNRIFFNNIVE